MSAVFEGVLCRAGVDALFPVVQETRAVCGVALKVSSFEEGVSVAFREDSRSEAAFTERMECVAAAISRKMGSALVVRYDDQSGHRSSIYFEAGVEVTSYSENDEIWVRLDEEGERDPSSPRYRIGELKPEEEYETIENAIQLGLRDFGWSEWEQLHHFMTR